MLGIGRLFSFMGAQIRKLLRGLYNSDPAAVYEAQIEIATEKVKHGMDALETLKGQVSSVQRQKDAAQQKVDSLDHLIKAWIGKDESKARLYAGQMQTAQTELKTFTAQFNALNNNYTITVNNIKVARDKIVNAKAEAASMKIQLKVSEASAQAAKLVSGLSDINGDLLGDIGDARAAMQAKIDKNNATMQVQTDLGIDGGTQLKEAAIEADAGTEDILTKYKIDAGLVPAPTESAVKTIGPATNAA